MGYRGVRSGARAAEQVAEAVRTSCVMMLRHPFDMVASGRRRAATTSNWRGMPVEEHCRNWLGAYELAQDLAASGIPVIAVKWVDPIRGCAGHPVRQLLEQRDRQRIGHCLDKCSELRWWPLDEGLPSDSVEYPAEGIRRIVKGETFSLHGWPSATPS